MQELEDDVFDRHLELDMSIAGRVYRTKNRPPKKMRQKIIKFIGQEGGTESFLLRQTIPLTGCIGNAAPTPAQSEAVIKFFGKDVDTDLQANTMLSVRDYASHVSYTYKFTAPRRVLITMGVAAFLLSDRNLRDQIRYRGDECWERREDIGFGIAHHYPYKLAVKYAEQLIADMQCSGSDVFG